jgi:hypothetical protein
VLYKLIAPAPFGADQETGKSRHMLHSQFEPDECNITSAGSMVNPSIAEGPLNHGPSSAAIPSVPRFQRHRLNWERMGRLAQRWLPHAQILHPYPEARFDART